MQPHESPQPDLVRLRPARQGDAELLSLWRGEPTVARYQPLGAVSLQRLRIELGAQNHHDLYQGRGDKYQWIIESGDRAAGWITLVATNWEHGLAELGYALSTPFQRRGIIPQALRLLLKDLFRNTTLERIEARCAVENIGSSKVLEALGFTREGLLRRYFRLRGERVDNYLYAILREDFVGADSP